MDVGEIVDLEADWQDKNGGQSVHTLTIVVEGGTDLDVGDIVNIDRVVCDACRSHGEHCPEHGRHRVRT